jgi:hypothetical protein
MYLATVLHSTSSSAVAARANFGHPITDPDQLKIMYSHSEET